MTMLRRICFMQPTMPCTNQPRLPVMSRIGSSNFPCCAAMALEMVSHFPRSPSEGEVSMARSHNGQQAIKYRSRHLASLCGDAKACHRKRTQWPLHVLTLLSLPSGLDTSATTSGVLPAATAWGSIPMNPPTCTTQKMHLSNNH